jgi:Rne/Rng family ribonuclease
LPGRFLAYGQNKRGVTLARGLEDAARERLKSLLSDWALPGEAIVARSEAGAADDAQLRDELESLRADWRKMMARETPRHAPSVLAKTLIQWPDIAEIRVTERALLAEAKAIFPAARHDGAAWTDSGAEDALEQALARVLRVGSVTLTFDITEALTVIDLDGGGLVPAEANRIGLAEIVRQIKLRGLAGHILIDLIPMKGKSDSDAMVAKLRRQLARDPSQVIGTTRLGLIEMTRERLRPSLDEWFFAGAEPQPLPAAEALAGLAALLRAADHQPLERLAMLAAGPIVQYLDSRPELLAEAAQRLGYRPQVRRDVRPHGYEIMQDPK